AATSGRRRGGRAVECGGLENRYPSQGGSRVQIPPPPFQRAETRMNVRVSVCPRLVVGALPSSALVGWNPPQAGNHWRATGAHGRQLTGQDGAIGSRRRQVSNPRARQASFRNAGAVQRSTPAKDGRLLESLKERPSRLRACAARRLVCPSSRASLGFSP